MHLHKFLGELQFPSLRKYIVPAAKRVSADLLEFATPEIADVVSGRKKFKTAAKSAGRKIPRKQLGSGSRKSRKEVQAESFQQNLQHKPVGCEKTFSETLH